MFLKGDGERRQRRWILKRLFAGEIRYYGCLISRPRFRIVWSWVGAGNRWESLPPNISWSGFSSSSIEIYSGIINVPFAPNKNYLALISPIKNISEFLLFYSSLPSFSLNLHSYFKDFKHIFFISKFIKICLKIH